MVLTCLIASVWLVNGLFCKALDLVPRHRAIVARILGEGHARGRTIAIGCLETAMAAWIVSGVEPAVNAWTQIALPHSDFYRGKRHFLVKTKKSLLFNPALTPVPGFWSIFVVPMKQVQGVSIA